MKLVIYALLSVTAILCGAVFYSYGWKMPTMKQTIVQQELIIATCEQSRTNLKNAINDSNERLLEQKRESERVTKKQQKLVQDAQRQRMELDKQIQLLMEKRSPLTCKQSINYLKNIEGVKW